MLKETLYRLCAGKRVLLLGFGREGRSTLRLLTAVGGWASLTVADENRVDTGDIPLVCGENYQDAIEGSDVVFKSPGVVLKRPFDSYSAFITSQTEVFLSVYGRQCIGITGTKGKSTSSTLLYHVLKEAGIGCVLLGNIGIPPFDRVAEIGPHTLVVMELSCHQLEYTRFAPHTAVLLNIFEEHLDHYGTFEKYRAAKENIYRCQETGDFLFCNIHDLPQKGTCRSTVISVSGDGTPADVTVAEGVVHLPDGTAYTIPADRIRLHGKHNAFDIAVVYAIATRSGITDETFTDALISYEPLPHRLQPLGEIDGIRFYDDSISTIGETTMRALDTLPDTDTVLIGGMERGIDYTPLICYLSDSPVAHILLMEATGERIYKEAMALPVKRPERFETVGNLENAVAVAKRVTAKGRICLLSPAAASYGIFKNFEERGEVFQKLVKA